MQDSQVRGTAKVVEKGGISGILGSGNASCLRRLVCVVLRRRRVDVVSEQELPRIVSEPESASS